MPQQHFFDILRELTRHPSVVGYEHSFFRVLQRLLEERGAQVFWYDGLLVAQGNAPNTHFLSAHADRHGLVCTGPNEFQYAAFITGRRSDLLGNSVSEEMMTKIADRYPQQQVTAYEPWTGAYLGTGVIRQATIDSRLNNLLFDVEGLETITAGTPVAFSDRLIFENDRIFGQLDNVLTVAMLVTLFEEGYQGTAFFSAQEEIGSSWRYVIQWFRRQEIKAAKLICLDTSSFNTQSEADAQDVVLRQRDANAKFDPDLTKHLKTLCKTHKITVSFKDQLIKANNRLRTLTEVPTRTLGSTEMGRMIAAQKDLITGTTLQVPTVGYHTTDENTRVQSVDAVLKLLRLLTLEN